MKVNKKIRNYLLKNAKIAKKKNAKGFTLVELIVVIAIIGVLAVVLVPNMMKYVKNAGLTKANDAASKIAEQANLIATEMEMQGSSLTGTYYTSDVTFKTGDSNKDAFAAALNEAVEIPTGTTLAITFDANSGQVAVVGYQEEADAYVGIYPNPASRDGSSDSAKDWDAAIGEARKEAGISSSETPSEEGGETPEGGDTVE